MAFIYDLKAPALPQIKFTNRAAYKLLTGQDAAPNFAEDQKNWVDTTVLAAPADYGRRVTYLNVLALDDKGATKWTDATNEPDPTRRAFYAQYNIKLVPMFESLQLATTQVTSVNLGYEIAGAAIRLIWPGPMGRTCRTRCGRSIRARRFIHRPSIRCRWC
jgi:hypothetical protein